MLLRLHCKHHKSNFSHNDILMNKNVEVVLVNTLFIREITSFDISQMNGLAFGYFDYLYGSKSTLWYDDCNKLNVVEDVETIYAMLNGDSK